MQNIRMWFIVATVAIIACAGLAHLPIGVSAAAVYGDTPQKGRRIVPVTNVVPTGAQPINGDVVKVEVLDAVDLKGANWQLKVAIRIRSARGMRVRCALKLEFDGTAMGQPWQVDLPSGQSDLTVFSCYCGDQKAADHLSKLTAEASNIRLGD
jgi:hypothetical protein